MAESDVNKFYQFLILRLLPVMLKEREKMEFKFGNIPVVSKILKESPVDFKLVTQSPWLPSQTQLMVPGDTINSKGSAVILSQWTWCVRHEKSIAPHVAQLHSGDLESRTVVCKRISI